MTISIKRPVTFVRAEVWVPHLADVAGHPDPPVDLLARDLAFIHADLPLRIAFPRFLITGEPDSKGTPSLGLWSGHGLPLEPSPIHARRDVLASLKLYPDRWFTYDAQLQRVSLEQILEDGL